MSKYLTLLAVASAISLGACSTVPVGGTILHTHGVAVGLHYGADGATLGGATVAGTSIPFVAKDSKGNIVQLTVPDSCGRANAVAVTDIQSGSANVNTSINTTNPAPTYSAGVAINQGTMVGEPAILDGEAKLQAAAGPTHAVALERGACAQALAAQGTGAANSTPVP